MIYFEAVGVGLLIWVGFFVYSLFRLPNSVGESVFIVLGLIYAAFGVWYGRRRRRREWLLALCLSSIYLLLTSYGLYRTYQYNQTYGGWFWTNRFFFSPILLYISLPVAAFFGARFGARRSWLRFAPLVVVLVTTFVAIGYARSGPGRSKLISYSCDISDTPQSELVFRMDLKLGFQTTDEPMRFRTIPAASGKSDGGWKVTVIRKSQTFSPGIHMTMTIDGKPFENSMWPINSPDGSSHIDFSQNQDYRDIVNWKVGPNPDLMVALVNAHRIEMSWGNLNIVLPDEQVASLRNFIRDWGRLLKEEGLLCTNPQCVQGAFNPRR